MSHHSVKVLTIFFERHGLELIDVERVSIQHGSLVGIVQKKGAGRPVAQSVQALLDLKTTHRLDKIDTLKHIAEQVTQLRQRTKGLVTEWLRSDTRVAGY